MGTHPTNDIPYLYETRNYEILVHWEYEIFHHPRLDFDSGYEGYLDCDTMWGRIDCLFENLWRLTHCDIVHCLLFQIVQSRIVQKSIILHHLYPILCFLSHL